MRFARLGDVILGEGRVKIISPVLARDGEELLARVTEMGHEPVDAVEWRIDYLEDAPSIGPVLETAALLASRSRLPVLATFRTAAEGGEKPIDDSDYRDLLLALVGSGSVAAVDVEFSRGDHVSRPVIAAANDAGLTVVVSYHDFAGTPPAAEIAARLDAMGESGADVLKLAVMAGSPEDVLTLMQATHAASLRIDRPLITVSMGDLGVLSRVAGGLVGSSATFAKVGPASAPGQVPAGELAPVLAALRRWTSAD
ncbi:MAG TPA: type I 3-dehydroquinate dehydratase [Actinomycetaceae bacterium]|nr:type I 3-dehydroquinate dehydratase [Actinomycetaceae bacterium]